MQPEQIRELLEHVKAGTAGIDEAFVRLAELPFSDLGDAKIDNHRALRCGFAEVVLCRGKEPRDVMRIIEEGLRSSPMMLATRAEKRHVDAIRERFPSAVHNPRGATVRVGQPVTLKARGSVMVVTAGTGDIPVAEEALETLRAFGCDGYHCYDVGVAGLHRVLAALPRIREAAVIICVAGMDGALPSVLGGLVASPVIAVPTSIGYGASFGGVAALLSMLNSCAGGVSVVNIDNGFGAAMTALRMVADRAFPIVEPSARPIEILEKPDATASPDPRDAQLARLEKALEDLTASLAQQKNADSARFDRSLENLAAAVSRPVIVEFKHAPIPVSTPAPAVAEVIVPPEARPAVTGVPPSAVADPESPKVPLPSGESDALPMAEKSAVVKAAGRVRKTESQPRKTKAKA